MRKIIGILFLLIIFQGCGTKQEDDGQKIYGTFISVNGKYSKIEFGKKEDGSIGDGHEVLIDGDYGSSYKIENNEIIILAPPSMGGDITFQIKDDNILKGENGDPGIYSKK
ncbi:hypothetical protein BH11BAC7_BH11BAC7_26280 [soil metagenome]